MGWSSSLWSQSDAAPHEPGSTKASVLAPGSFQHQIEASALAWTLFMSQIVAAWDPGDPGHTPGSPGWPVILLPALTACWSSTTLLFHSRACELTAGDFDELSKNWFKSESQSKRGCFTVVWRRGCSSFSHKFRGWWIFFIYFELDCVFKLFWSWWHSVNYLLAC